ncbi:uncharacterized protein [Amphiura filiformis]|uniref:uncharacterized protein n=1 Tax=Amphiura filiformis TaxID=82378 RepID=UPI003B220CC6
MSDQYDTPFEVIQPTTLNMDSFMWYPAVSFSESNHYSNHKFLQAPWISSLHVNHTKSLSSYLNKKSVLLYFAILLIAQSHDTEMNPGPYAPKYPCGVCKKAVRWSRTRTAVAYDTCNTWYHTDCMGMSSLTYQGLNRSDVSWICAACDTPNHSSSILDSYLSETETENKFQALSDLDTSTINSSVDSSCHPPVPSFEIKCEGVQKLLSQIKPHTACGPDNLPAYLLKECAEELAPVFTLLFKATLHQGRIPSEWKSANVTPIFKKGDKHKPENYRPISLTASIVCKTIEHIIHSQIIHHLDNHGLLAETQFGFRKRRSCESQLLLTINDLAEGLRDKHQIDTILLDFSKAFDRVPHERLLQKLHHYGVRGHLHSWIRDFLTGVTDVHNKSPSRGRRAAWSPVAYTIHGSALRTVDEAKYLGVTIHRNLSWKPHVSNISKKSNSTLGFLRRNLRKCPPNIKEKAYKTYVRPTLEFASSVWDPHTKDQVSQIDMIQRRAARFVKSDYNQRHSVIQMLARLQWQSLYERRAHSKVIMLYRIIHGLGAIPAAPPYLFPSTESTRGHQHQFKQQHCRIQSFQHSYFPSVICIWNTLPASVVTAQSLEIFRIRLKPLTLR